MAENLCVLVVTVVVYGYLLLPVLSTERISLRSIGTYYSQTEVWKDARKLCRNRGGKLLTIKDLDYWDKLVDRLNTTDTRPTIWIGGREDKASWIWSHDLSTLQKRPLGCFTERFSYPSNFTNNQPTLCSSFCRHSMKTLYAGLKGSECFCLHEETKFKSVLDVNCNKLCPGNRYQLCGGDKSVTVYNTQGELTRLARESGSRERLVSKSSSYNPYQNRSNHYCSLVGLFINRSSIRYTQGLAVIRNTNRKFIVMTESVPKPCHAYL